MHSQGYYRDASCQHGRRCTKTYFQFSKKVHTCSPPSTLHSDWNWARSQERLLAKKSKENRSLYHSESSLCLLKIGNLSPSKQKQTEKPNPKPVCGVRNKNLRTYILQPKHLDGHGIIAARLINDS